MEPRRQETGGGALRRGSGGPALGFLGVLGWCLRRRQGGHPRALLPTIQELVERGLTVGRTLPRGDRMAGSWLCRILGLWSPLFKKPLPEVEETPGEPS